MTLIEKNFNPSLFCFLIVALTFGGFACGNNNGMNADGKSGTGSYSAKLIFPPEVPRIGPAAQPSVKAVVGGIDCAGYGIATLHCVVRAADDTLLAEADWQCSDRKGVVGSIPPGTGITVVVTANSKNGTALLRGEDRGVIIEADKNTEGGEINLHPADSPTVVAGGDPKTLVFDWSHIDFPAGVDHYRLEVDPDGDNEESPFGPVEDAEDIRDTEFTLTVPVHLTDWVNALYRVAALDADNNVVETSSDIDLLTSVAPEEVIGYLKAGNPDVGAHFGASVAISTDGNTLAVGASCEDGDGTGGEDNDAMPDAGAVYIFTRSGNAWSLQADLKAGNPGEDDWFGSSVALSGDGNTLAVGAYGEDSNGIGGEDNNDMDCAGAVYVFTRSGSAWSPQDYLKADNPEANSSFGDSVALSGDGNILAVGALLEDSHSTDGETNRGAGAVYVFTRNGSAWSRQDYLRSGNTALFGRSVALSADGNTLAVGAQGLHSEDNDVFGAGEVYIFTRSGSTWSQQGYLNSDSPLAYGFFGNSVALSDDGDTLAVGAPKEDVTIGKDNDTMPRAGAVYIFTRSGNAWSPQVYLKADNPGENYEFGISVSLSGNGDTLAVGACGEDGDGDGGDDNDAMPDAGAVYVFTRSSNAWIRQDYLKAGYPAENDWFGNSVSLSGDGDTLAIGARDLDGDVTIGEDNDDIPGAGAVYLY